MSEEIKVLFPEGVEKIIISKNDYDRLYGKMTLENIELEQEIEQLQNRITELEEINKQHQELNGTLRKRIDKAVEYINKNKKVVSKYEAKDTRLPLGTFMWGVDNLLNILQDKEEV